MKHNTSSSKRSIKESANDTVIDKEQRKDAARIKSSRVFGVIRFFLLFVALQVASFYTIAAIFAAAYGESTSVLPAIAQFVLSLILGLVYLALLIMLGWLAMHLFGYGKNRIGGDFDGDQIFDAMDRIAHGDFNVLIKPSANIAHNMIVEAVNNMAQQLGTMEHLRQDFISNVSHEIQSPLTSISGFAELLQSGTLTPEQEQHYIAIIIAESKRISRLSDNLLKLSSLEAKSTPLVRTEYRLDKQLESAILTLEPQWRKKQLVLEMDSLRAEFCGDEELMSQVWVNLLSNAIKFTPAGGTISVALVGGDNANTWQVAITDSGIGIPEEDQMHIFERFYKVDKARDRSAGGNGLGLSLVKKIVELHGGSICVKSTPNNGSTFTTLLSPQQLHEEAYRL